MVNRYVGIIGLLITISASLAGQGIAQMSMPNFTPSLMFPVITNPCPGGRCPAVSGRGSASAPQRSANLAALGFSPSAARRQQNLARFVERSNGDTALRQFSAQSGQIFPQLQALLATYGLDANNVADAYTVWWISAWDAAHGQTGTRPKSTYQAVRAQSAQALLSTSGFDPRDDAQKQEMAEALLVQAVFIDVGVEQAAGDPEQLRAIGNAVAQGARAMGLDLSAITLTSNGFQRK